MPVTWQIVGVLLLGAVAVAVVFLSLASYARTEVVRGEIVLDTGVVTIVPSRSGVISSVQVSEGQNVRPGDVLAQVRAEEDMLAGDTAPARIREAITRQDRILAGQGDMLLAAATAERLRLGVQIGGLSNEIESLDRQIADQIRLVDMSRAHFEQARGIAESGFVSRLDLEARESTLLLRRQQLAQLQQSRVTKSAAIAEARAAITQSEMSVRANVAGAQSDRASLTQQLAQADLSSGYALTSPIEGTVTALTARPGQRAAERPLMMIIPSNARRRVELYVPTSAAGFIRKGQEVRVAIDAFPYARFGTIDAVISEISATTILQQTPEGSQPVYLVSATLPEPWVRAFGRQQTLVPGMTLTARIVTEKRTLIEWLFEPLFSIRERSV